MNLGPHGGFIVAAYAIASVVVAGLICWIVADHRAQTKRLAELERSGMARRSARGAEPS